VLMQQVLIGWWCEYVACQENDWVSFTYIVIADALLLFLGYPWSFRGENSLEWVCLVNRITVEVEWLLPLVRFQDCAPYWLEWLVIKLISSLIWDWARKLRAIMWSITRWEGWEWIRRYSGPLGGIPRLCRLRTASCWALWNKHWTVLTHAEFMVSRKPNSFCNCLVKM
jgi:hypothetical protein